MSKARDIADLDFNSPDIDGGNIDGATIGGTTPAAGSFTGINISGGAQLGQDYAYFKSNSTSNASLTLRKDSSGADAIDFLQLRNDGNSLIGKIEGDGDISFGAATFTGTINSGAITSSGNFLLETTGNPSITNKTTGAGNNPTFRLQADTNYWDFQGTFSNTNDDLFFMYNGASKFSLTNAGAATFSSTISAVGSANSTSASHIPALLGSGSYGGGIATRDGAESGWYQQTSGADWHFYHNRTVASQTPESKRVLSFNSTGDAKIYGHLMGDDDSSYFRINAGPGGGGAIYLNGTNRANYNNHIQYMADVHNFGDADGNPINTLQVVSDASLVTVNGALNVTGDVTATGNLSSSGGAAKVGGTSTVFTNSSFTITGTAQTVVPRSAITGLPTGTYLMTISLSGGNWYSSTVTGIVQHYNGTTNSTSSGGPNGIYLTSSGHAQNSGDLFARYQTFLGNASNHGVQIWGTTQTTTSINIQWKRLA